MWQIFGLWIWVCYRPLGFLRLLYRRTGEWWAMNHKTSIPLSRILHLAHRPAYIVQDSSSVNAIHLLIMCKHQTSSEESRYLSSYPRNPPRLQVWCYRKNPNNWTVCDEAQNLFLWKGGKKHRKTLPLSPFPDRKKKLKNFSTLLRGKPNDRTRLNHSSFYSSRIGRVELNYFP